jgi:putative hemolysin
MGFEVGLLEAVGLCVALVWVGLLSSVETALVGVPAVRLDNAIHGHVKHARRLLFWVKNSARVLTTLHFMRLISVCGLCVGTYALLDRGGYTVFAWWWVLLLSVCVLLFGHIAPRAVAKRYALEWAILTAPVTYALVWVCYPVVQPIMWMGAWMAQWAGVVSGEVNPFWTPDEIGRVTEDARAEGLGEQGEHLLLSIIQFSDTIIREIMVPRTDMVSIALDCPRSELRDVLIEAAHSRLPVYEDTIDNIVGLLHVRDVLAHDVKTPREDADFDLKTLLRPTFYVPEVMKISELLREFQRRKTHMAIVVDEYGGTAGVVTLEDIIEEIVGEIQDEYDVEEKQFRHIADNKIIADGRVSVWDLEETLEVDFPDDADYETLAGFLMSRTGYLPRTGDVVTWANLRFSVKEANEKRVGMVEIEKIPDPSKTRQEKQPAV